MAGSAEKSSIEKIISSASSFLIILKSHPSFDQVATALSLHLALQNAKKHSHIACDTYASSQFTTLIAHEQVHPNVGNHSLEISFDYNDDTVENVSYNIDQEHKKFSLVVRPKKGHPALDPTTVEYNHVGIDAEVIFLIGVAGFDQIPNYYTGEENAFTQAHTVAINRSETAYAEENLDISSKSSFSEYLIHKLKEYKLKMDSDIATNILAGIESATNAFQHASVTAETFESVAELMHIGAKRVYKSGSNNAASNPLAQALAQKPSSTSIPVQPVKSPMQQPSQFAPSMR